MLNFRTVYKVLIRTSEGDHSGGLAIGPRVARRDDGYGKVRDGIEWIPNSPFWTRRHAFLAVESEDQDRLVARDVLSKEMGYDVQYVFTPLTLDTLEDVVGREEILRMVSSDEELQEFYFHDWIRDDWDEHSLDKQEGIDLANLVIQEALAAKVGEVHQWKKGLYQKQKDGSWKPVEEPETVPAPRRELPGAWKDKAEGLPESSHKAHWDPETGDYTPERKQLHEEIRQKVFSGIRPVPESRRPVALVTMGLPAAGKSSVVTDVINRENFAHIDTDAIREALPEFKDAVEQRARNGGTIVAREAASVADDFFNEARASRMNMVFEAVGASPWILEQLEKLKEDGYKVQVLMVHEDDVESAIDRVEKRGRRTGRFVPHERVREAHPVIPKMFMRATGIADEFFVYQSGDPPVMKWKKEEGDEDPRPLDPEFHRRLTDLAKNEWMYYLASRLFLSEDKKLPADKSASQVVDMIERMWKKDREELEKTPETYTDGVIVPLEDPDPKRG